MTVEELIALLADMPADNTVVIELETYDGAKHSSEFVVERIDDECLLTDVRL